MAYRLLRNLTFLFFVSILMMPGFVHGQARTEGQLSGTIQDPSGALVPDATLTVDQESTGFTTTVTTNASGSYVFANLQPGTYKLTINAKGFGTKVYNEVVVNTARTTDLKGVDLQVGAAANTVEVSAVGEVLRVPARIRSRPPLTRIRISRICPSGGRDVLPFAQLVPGAQVGGDLRFTTYNSMPNGAINISVDGTNNNFQRFSHFHDWLLSRLLPSGWARLRKSPCRQVT